MLSPNTILRERYRIIHHLGHGGMGAVYQAMDENLSCVVAVKETFAATDEQRRAFRREAELLANLSHPTLPGVIEHFTHGDGQFLVMQFVPGHDLAELLELRDQPFAVAKVLDWADQLLDALEDLHSSNPPIIHRDIKPANLKVTPKGRILLLDFGLAKGSAGQMSTVEFDSHGHSIYGYTPNYAPLEQIRNAGTDPRSDLYSLAATLWTLLTGKVPPDALTRVGEKEEGNPDPLHSADEMNSEVSPAIANVLNRALAVNRNQRYASAEEMRNDLRQARESKFEAPTLLKEEPAPEPGSTKPPPSEGPSLKPTEYRLPKSASSDQHVPTMHVDAPPRVPSWSDAATANSLVEETSHKGRSKRSVLVASAAVALALVAGLFVWRPWARNQPSSPSTPSSKSSNMPRVLTNQAGIELLLITSGTFMMGSTNGEANEKPVHQVTISHSFYMGKYEVTQTQWKSLMGNNPAYFKYSKGCGGASPCPVETISWDDVQKFLQKLNEMQDGYSYRLPTEAEWEYACRAGTTGDYSGKVGDIAWYKENSWEDSLNRTHPVGTKQPNAWGLADMHGNVWELCEDWYHDTYDGAPSDGTAWLNAGEQRYRMIRGGSFYQSASGVRSATRRPCEDCVPFYNVGFRVVAYVRTQ